MLIILGRDILPYCHGQVKTVSLAKGYGKNGPRIPLTTENYTNNHLYILARTKKP